MIEKQPNGKYQHSNGNQLLLPLTTYNSNKPINDAQDDYKPPFYQDNLWYPAPPRSNGNHPASIPEKMRRCLEILWKKKHPR